MRGMGAFGLVVWQPQTARVRRAHHPPLPGTINLVCATREHVRLPGHHMPALMGAMREQGGLAWRPRLSAQKKGGGGPPGWRPPPSVSAWRFLFLLTASFPVSVPDSRCGVAQGGG